MSKISNKIFFYLNLLGFDAKRLSQTILGIPYFLTSLAELKRQNKIERKFTFGQFYPILSERFSEGGTARGHYFHQDLLVAQKLFKNNPVRHVDVGSRVDGFVAHVAAFRKIEIFDIRPVYAKVRNMHFSQADLMELSPDMEGVCDSLSSLHAVEHFGLGRYGDRIDLHGHIKAIKNLTRMLSQGGKFYLSVPIGPERIEFNAHRVLSLKTLLQEIESDFILDTFSYVDDQGDLHEDVTLSEAEINNNFSCQYGCGILELTKKREHHA